MKPERFKLKTLHIVVIGSIAFVILTVLLIFNNESSVYNNIANQVLNIFQK